MYSHSETSLFLTEESAIVSEVSYLGWVESSVVLRACFVRLPGTTSDSHKSGMYVGCVLFREVSSVQGVL